MVYDIILFLVVGYRNLGVWEWTGIAAGPVLIYLIRTVFTAYFNFRVDVLSKRLNDQQSERAKIIQKLKDATKYDSTMQLLEKYGGNENKREKSKNAAADEDIIPSHGKEPRHSTGSGTPNRTNLPPPPTANIPRVDFPAPQQQPLPLASTMHPTAEFAPNAFAPGAAPPSQYAQMPTTGAASHWYDRIMDLLLGEDETAPQNRIALICHRCRLVNGQAPPGTKSLAEVGMWRCMGCGDMNGEMDEGQRIVREVLGDNHAPINPASSDRTDNDGDEKDESSDLVDVDEDMQPVVDGEAENAVAKSTGTNDHGSTRRRKGKR
jgi:hypothetical protein